MEEFLLRVRLVVQDVGAPNRLEDPFANFSEEVLQRNLMRLEQGSRSARVDGSEFHESSVDAEPPSVCCSRSTDRGASKQLRTACATIMIMVSCRSLVRPRSSGVMNRLVPDIDFGVGVEVLDNLGVRLPRFPAKGRGLVG
jgi:hypothetical protein